MILSHDWRFIHLKTHKTAGTSVELSLSALCGPLDIITPTWGPEEDQRLGASAAELYSLSAEQAATE